MHIVGKDQTHSSRDANLCESEMSKNMPSSMLHLKLHLILMLQDLETHML